MASLCRDRIPGARIWAICKVTSPTRIPANSGDPTSLSQQYGPVWFSHPQRFIINYAYDLPFGKHDGALGYLLSGWNVGGVTTVQDGTPLTITDATGGTIYGAGVSRAQMCPGATYATAATPGGIEARLGGASGGPGYINTSAFCSADLPQIGNGTGYGNSGVGILLGPGNFNFDFSLMKTTRIKERQSDHIPGGSLQPLQSPAVWQPGDCGLDSGHLRPDHHCGQPADRAVCAEVQLLKVAQASACVGPAFFDEEESRAFLHVCWFIETHSAPPRDPVRALRSVRRLANV